MNRWCPSCGKAWPAARAVCPTCLVELVDDPNATVVCRHCGMRCPARMQSCPNCLGELRPDPAAAADALVAVLGAGGHLFRPESLALFRDGPSCTLLRLSGRGGLAFLGGDGFVEATVDSAEGGARPPLACQDVAGPDLFELVRYEAADDALVAMGVDGAPLATFLRAGDDIAVRDETSAPAAILRAVRGGFELVETGGSVLATAGTTDDEVDGWRDDQWWLRPTGARLPLRPLAAVALVLAAKVLLGRPFPVPAGSEGDAGPIGS